MMAAPTLVYSYVRMSSVTQIKGDSARRQIEQARAYAEQRGFVLAPPLQDLGVSAFKGRNRQKGALGLFLNALKAGEIRPGILVIEAIDRLSREPPMEILMLLKEILGTGTSIHLLSLGQTLSAQSLTESMWLLPTIASMAQLAHTESRQKSERISAAYVTRRKQAREGEVLKGNYHPSWLSRHYLDDDKVEHRVIPEVADAVNRIFELAATGLGAHTIAKTLNQAGIAPPPASYSVHRDESKRRWYQAYVGRLTLDRRVLGEYQPMRKVGDRSVPEGAPIPGHYPAIITRELWDRVQAAKHPWAGRRTGVRNMKLANLFTDGLAVCGHCGGRMLVRGDYRKGAPPERLYLRCAGQQQGGVCDHRKTPRYERFEARVLAALPGIPWASLLKKAEPDAALQSLETQIQAICTAIESMENVSRRLLKVIESEDEPDGEIIARRREVQAEIARLGKEKGALIRERTSARVTAADDPHAVDQIAELTAMLKTEDEVALLETRQKLQAILKRVVKVARFYAEGDGFAMIEIRGGMSMRVPLGVEGEVSVGVSTDWRAFATQNTEGGVPALAPNREGTALVEAGRIMLPTALWKMLEDEGKLTKS